MWSISQKLAMPLSTLQALNPQVKPPTYQLNIGDILQTSAGSSGQSTGSTSGGSYTVQAGDYLYTIATKLGITLQALEAANPQVKPPNYLINVGDVLQIPGGSTSGARPAGSSPSKNIGPVSTPSGSYVVQSGDSMFSISQKLGITLPALEAANPQVKAPTYLLNIGAVLQIPGSAAPTAPTTAPSKPVSPAPNTAPGTYVVQPGDSLYSISQKLGVTLPALQAANPQVKPPVFLLNIGDVLQIPGSAGSNTGKGTGSGNNSSPAPGTYVVQPGDSMYTIAQKLNVQLSALEAANPQVKGPTYLINVRDVLKIPGGK